MRFYFYLYKAIGCSWQKFNSSKFNQKKREGFIASCSGEGPERGWSQTLKHLSGLAQNFPLLSEACSLLHWLHAQDSPALPPTSRLLLALFLLTPQKEDCGWLRLDHVSLLEKEVRHSDRSPKRGGGTTSPRRKGKDAVLINAAVYKTIQGLKT